MSKRIWNAVSALAAAAVIFGGSAQAQIKIGVIQPLTGPLAYATKHREKRNV